MRASGSGTPKVPFFSREEASSYVVLSQRKRKRGRPKKVREWRWRVEMRCESKGGGGLRRGNDVGRKDEKERDGLGGKNK